MSQNHNNLVAQVTLEQLKSLSADLKSGLQNGLYRDFSLTSLEELSEIRQGLDTYVGKLERSFKRSGINPNGPVS